MQPGTFCAAFSNAVNDSGVERFRIEQGDGRANQARFAQPFDAPQARGRGQVHLGRERDIGDGGVALQLAKDRAVGAVDVDGAGFGGGFFHCVEGVSGEIKISETDVPARFVRLRLIFTIVLMRWRRIALYVATPFNFQ